MMFCIFSLFDSLIIQEKKELISELVRLSAIRKFPFIDLSYNLRKMQTLIDLKFLCFIPEMKRRTLDVRAPRHACTASPRVHGVRAGALWGTNSVSIKSDLSPLPKTCLRRQKASVLERIQNTILIVISRIPRFSPSSPPFSPPPQLLFFLWLSWHKPHGNRPN